MASSSSFYGGNPTPTEYRDIDDLVAQAEEAANTALNAGTNAEADAAAADAARIAAEAARDASSASAVASSNSATNSASSATNAAASALAASNSASNASTSASNAQTSANNASTSAGSAAASATNAANSANSALASAAAALVSEQNADASEAAAASSATAAASSASAASTSATNAATSATAAASSQSAAATSASNAATSASNAASSASAAAGSATTASSASSAAASAQAAAEAARDQTLLAYDNFDDRYLGAKTSDPTLDNDGNALVAGSLYFNSVDGAMKVYTGTVWVDAYAAGLSFLAKVNNLSDLPNVATARTNLGLGTAATQNSTAFANASHTHPISDVTNLQTTLDGKAALSHTHAIADVTNLQTSLDAKLNVAATTYVQQDGTSGSAYLPAGSTAQRPGTPAAGYIRYNTTTGKFEGYGSAWGNIGGGAAIGDTPPANPGAGDLWWNSADGRMYVYYTDANSSQWVDLSAGGAGQYLPLTGGTVTGNVSVTGNLGIGTSSPGAALHTLRTSAGAATVGAFLQNSSNSTSTETRLAFSANTNILSDDRYGWIGYVNTGGTNGGALTFATTPGGQPAAERVRIDGSGNVGIGTSSPSYRLQVSSNGGTDNAYISAVAGAGYFGVIGSKPLVFETNATERARIGSDGIVRINNTTGADGRLHVYGNNPYRAIGAQVDVTSGFEIISFRNPNGIIGTINTSGSTTSYNTASDYRLKENVQPMQNALATVAQLRPVTYTWKIDGSNGQGFIAHELQPLFPDAVSGEKDGVYADGSPKYQSVDTSFLVATLTKAIQELNAKVDALQSEITVLKGGE